MHQAATNRRHQGVMSTYASQKRGIMSEAQLETLSNRQVDGEFCER